MLAEYVLIGWAPQVASGGPGGAVRYRLLGRVEVIGDDGQFIPLAARKERTLLAALLLSANRAISAERLIDAMWDDTPPASAVNALQVQVSRLRKRLVACDEGELLVRETSGYRLLVQPGELDVDRFEELARFEGDAAESSRRLGEALALWSGPALVDVDSVVLRGDATRLDDLRWSVLERRIDADLRLGRHLTLVAELEAVVAEEPLREGFVGQLMVALYRSGRQAEALAVYRHTREVLADQLGIDPSPALRALELSVLSQSADLDTPPATVRSGAPARVLPSGTVTFLFTDIEGSSRLWEERPDAMRSALERHDQLLRAAIGARSGYVFSGAGDGVAAAFSRAVDAVGAAVEAQLALSAEPWSERLAVRVRMGIHTGEADERDGSYFGSSVNRAARLMAAAHGGQIVMSDVSAGVANQVDGIELVDLGLHHLRGLVEPSRVFGIKAHGLDWLDHELATGEREKGNLPRAATEWFGPIELLHERVRELARARLVTFTGPGGVGKTRLAIEVAALVADDFPDGVWMMELASVSDPGAVHASIAVELGVTVQTGRSPLEAILDWLEDRRVLVMLDNCEHVLEPVASLVMAIVGVRPKVTVIATSREPLGIAGECIRAVPSLEVGDAAELFYDRAGGAGSTSTLVEEDRNVVEAICERLDGIPLAIELAAARTRSLTPADLLERLSDGFRVLRGSRFAASERHQTLRATMAWSYRLLSSHEQLLFDRLSVFAGGFDLPAAEAVCSMNGIEREDVLDLLAELVDKSLIVARRSDVATRFVLLETIRQYAEERLGERGETDTVRHRHLIHYLTLADEVHQLYSDERWSDGRRLAKREWDNLRLAHVTTIDTAHWDLAQRLVKATFRHAFSDGLVEWIGWVERTVVSAESRGHTDSSLLGQAAAVAFVAGDYPNAVQLGKRGVASAVRPDPFGMLMCWGILAMTHVYTGEIVEALAGTEELERVPTDGLDPLDASWKPNLLVLIAMVLQPDRVQRHLLTLRDLADLSGSPWIAMLHAYAAGLASLGTQPPDWDAALRLCRRGLFLARSSNCAMHIANGLEYLTFACPGLSVADADRTCWEAISYSFERRIWAVLWTVMGYTVGQLLRRGSARLAATVAGYLEANQPGILPLCVFLPEGTLDVLADVDHFQAKAQGAELDRTEVVTRVLSELSGRGEQPHID